MTTNLQLKIVAVSLSSVVRSLDWDLAVVSAQRSWAEIKESNFWPQSSGDVSASKLTPIVGKCQFLIGAHPCWLVGREGSQLHPVAQQSGIPCHVVPSILEPTVIHQIILQPQISDHSFCDQPEEAICISQLVNRLEPPSYLTFPIYCCLFMKMIFHHIHNPGEKTVNLWETSCDSFCWNSKRKLSWLY